MIDSSDYFSYFNLQKSTQQEPVDSIVIFSSSIKKIRLIISTEEVKHIISVFFLVDVQGHGISRVISEFQRIHVAVGFIQSVDIV